MESPTDQKPQRRGPWSQREDELLKHYVAIQGPLCWVRISSQIGTRSSKQCRERYHQNLKPSLNHNPISAEEGAQIEEMVAKIGKRWAEIARSLNNRSDNAVKNWWNGSMNRRRRLIRRQNSTIQESLPPTQSESPYYLQGTPQLPLPLPPPLPLSQHDNDQAAAGSSPLAAALAPHPSQAASSYLSSASLLPAYPQGHGQTSPSNYSSHISPHHHSRRPLDTSEELSPSQSHHIQHPRQSPRHQSQQTVGLWGKFSGLPSPSLTSPSVKSQDPSPKLASTSSAKSSASQPPSSFREHPSTLPPLRFGNGEFPANQLLPQTFVSPQLQLDYSSVRLPPIRDCLGSNQLPTAPNSPRGQSPGPKPQSTPAREGDEGGNLSLRKLSINDLLS